MENTKTQRLSEKGLFLTAKEIADLQEQGSLDLEIQLAGESAYYSFALFEWLMLPQGAIKIALPQPSEHIWLKTDTIMFFYHTYYQNIRVPSSVSVRIFNEVLIK